MSMTATRNHVAIPAPAVRVGGVMSVARVIDITDPHDQLGAQYESQACASGQILTDLCAPHTGKVFDDMTWVTGEPFVVYTGVECDFMQSGEAERKINERFGFIESASVDQGVLADLAALDVPVGAGAEPLASAVGILEATMAVAYGGVATLYVPANLVTQGCAANVFHRQADGTIVTCQGSKVANMAAWDGTLQSATHTIYASGQITILRGPLLGPHYAPNFMEGATYHPARALAERVYVPLIECVVFSTTATSAVTP